MAARLKTRVRSDWAQTVLVCAKCSKKMGGGFGPKGKTALAKALRKQVGAKNGRKSPVGIVEVKCLGVCPKRAVTVIDGARPREWVLVPEGADVGAVAVELGLVQGCR
ncbi:hypothetical protein ACX0GZ_02030 [Sphingomonas aestuarii]